MLEQLFSLRRENEAIFSLGPPPDLALVAGTKGTKIHKLTNNQFPGRQKASLPNGAVLHIWGPETFRSTMNCNNTDSAPLVLSLAHLPQSSKQRAALLDWIRCRNIIVTVPTQYVRDELLRGGVGQSEISVLPPAAKPPDGSAEEKRGNIRKKIRESLGISNSDRLVVVPAEMQREAGHKLASWAHAIVEQIIDGCKIVFPGAGPYERSVRFFSDTTGYPDDIFFTGNRFAIRDILAAADIAAFFYRQDCGITILSEAMSAGLTILAASTPDVTATCRHEENALLVNHDDPRAASASLLRVMDDDGLAKRLGQNAAKFAAANFGSIEIRRQLDEIYTHYSWGCR